MTPFGIRKMIKKLLGLGGDKSDSPGSGAPVRKERPRVNLIVVDEEGMEQSVEGSANDSLVYISGNMGKPIGTGCSDATCGTCRVEVLDGEENLTPQEARERSTLKENGFSEELRLGCCALLREGGAKVRAFEFIVI
jgi:ferredoxin